MFWEVVATLLLLSMSLFLLWTSYLTFSNRNKEWTDKTTGMRISGNTSRENWQAVGAAICGSFILFFVVLSVITR
jgi:TRAP-type C4-dicarboxylate transport system permease small subunit